MKPDYKLIKKSLIHDLQTTYNNYKKDYIKLLENTHYSNNGTFCIAIGYEDIIYNIHMYTEKISELKDEIKKLEEKMKEDNYDN